MRVLKVAVSRCTRFDASASSFSWREPCFNDRLYGRSQRLLSMRRPEKHEDQTARFGKLV